MKILQGQLPLAELATLISEKICDDMDNNVTDIEGYDVTINGKKYLIDVICKYSLEFTTNYEEDTNYSHLETFHFDSNSIIYLLDPIEGTSTELQDIFSTILDNFVYNYVYQKLNLS